MSADVVNDGEGDFLQCFGDLDISDNDKSLTDDDKHRGSVSHSDVPNSAQSQYNGRKPKWWKNLCGKASKAQKRAMTEVLRDHQLSRPPYGSYITWEEIFPSSNDIWLEIGFGRGENLLALVDRHPYNSSFVGAEIHQPGIGTLCQRVLDGIQTKSHWKEYVKYASEPDPLSELEDVLRHSSPSEASNESVYSNLRIYPGDGIKLLPYIPPSSLAAVLITFPDPFPRKDQTSWRVVQLHTVLEIHRILFPSRGRFFLATDHEGFFEWSQNVIDQVNEEVPRFRRVEPMPDRLEWLPAISRYEQKGWDEGRDTHLSCWEALP